MFLITSYKSSNVDDIISLLNKLNYSELSSIQKHITSRIHNDFISLLPRELALNILSFSSPKTLLTLSAVNKYYQSLAQDNNLWKMKFKQSKWTLSSKYMSTTQQSSRPQSYLQFDHSNSLPRHISLERNQYEFTQMTQTEREEFIDGIRTGSLPRDFQSDFVQHLNTSHFNLKSCVKPVQLISDEIQLTWKLVYKHGAHLSKNWQTGKAKLTELQGHRDAIYALQFDKTKIITGSKDDTIKVWCLQTHQCIKTFTGHLGSVLCLEFNEKFIVSGSSDATIIVWDADTGKKIKILVGHAESVLNLKFDGKWIVSCSKDKTIKVFTFDFNFFINEIGLGFGYWKCA